MHIQNELEYFLRVLTKLHLPARLTGPDGLRDHQADLGLRRLLGLTADYRRTFPDTVVQHCGISDVNYFTKLFRKYYGVAPKKYREENGPR